MKSRILPTLCLVLGGALSALASEKAGATTPTVPDIDHMVYLSFLPDEGELMTDAKVNGLTILRLDKTADRVVVTYRYPDGHTATLGYARLDSVGGTDRVVVRRAEVERHTTVVVREEPEVVFVERPVRTRVIYRDPWDDFWAPLTIGFGAGWATGYHGHHHHRHYGHVTHRYPIYRGGWRGHDRSHGCGHDRGRGRRR